MRHMPAKRARHGHVHHTLVVMTALLCLATQVAAQSFQVGCPKLPEPPAFVARVVAELDGLQVHTQRWQEPVQWQRLLRELDRIRLDGLNPAHYFLPEITRISQQHVAGTPLPPCHGQLASLALAWSLTDLAYGRLDPEELGLIWHQNPQQPEAEAFARTIHQTFREHDGLRLAYQEARPAMASYRALRAAYRNLRRVQADSWPVVPGGPTLRQGDHDERVRTLASRLSAQGYLPREGRATDTFPDDHEPTAEAELFDEPITRAVAAFQRDHGLKADGLVGKETLSALNLPPAVWAARVRANLERFRWIAPYLERDMLLVDIAGARIHLLHNGAEVWRGNAQVGRPERKTPALTSAINHITVNPTWTIPPTIFYEDILPAVQTDPGYLSRNRLTVLDRTGTRLSPDQIDWSRPGNLLLRQAAGPENALGEVAIRFANPFAVYLHDTPSRQLFDTPERFYSSGCVRVEHAMDLSERLFRDSPAGLQQTINDVRTSGETRNITLPERLPLVMAYWTAEAGPEGTVRFRPDAYEEDTMVADLLETTKTTMRFAERGQ